MTLLLGGILIFIAGVICGIYYAKELSSANKIEMAAWVNDISSLQAEIMASEIKKFQSAIAMEIAIAQRAMIEVARTPRNNDEGGSGGENSGGGDKGPYLN